MTSERTPTPATPPQSFHFRYKVLSGLFLQSESSTNDADFDFRASNFGLIPRSYDTDEPESAAPQWKRFEHYVRTLAANATAGSSVKVLFLGRHGQGWHNVAETKYGTRAWDLYYSALPEYLDAALTPVGQQQALDVHARWKHQLPNGIPPPETYYVSPLTRTIETADLSFKNLPLPASKPYAPQIKELLREVLGVHTCDKRSTKTHLSTHFPHLTFEPGFADADELWEADYREPHSARRYRYGVFLDDVFANDRNVFLSLTAHSGAIAAMLEVVGHRAFGLETGGVIPVVVVAERVEGQREVPPKEPSDGPELLKEPPEEVRN